MYCRKKRGLGSAFLLGLINSSSNIDIGVLFVAFISLILLSSVFIMISICVSLNFKNQFNIFLISFLICLFDYYLINLISESSNTNNLYNFINNIGIQLHYHRLSIGIINLYDIIYFALNIFLFFICLHIGCVRRCPKCFHEFGP